MAFRTDVPRFTPGARVQVRCRFDGRWVSGFVASALGDDAEHPAIRVRRLSDGSVLPHDFTIDEVRVDA
jgi:hypothetical protein